MERNFAETYALHENKKEEEKKEFKSATVQNLGGGGERSEKLTNCGSERRQKMSDWEVERKKSLAGRS